jgi:hypothetical protein
MLIHAFPDNGTSIRVHLSNSLDSLDQTVSKAFVDCDKIIKSEKVKCYLPLNMA